MSPDQALELAKEQNPSDQTMSEQILSSRLKPKSPEFIANAQKMHEQVEDLKKQVALSAQGGNERSRTRHTQRGKLLPRDRIERCLLYTSPSPRDKRQSRMPSSA